MSHFNLKSLSFYGIAISSVLVLFKVVSAYGETHLTAAPEIGGTYKIVETENLPACLANQDLSLTIEQSGIYLFGSLAKQAAVEEGVKAADKSKAPNQAPSQAPSQAPNQAPNQAILPLSGDFEGDEIIMSGQGDLPNCDPGLQLVVQGHRENDKLIGTIAEGAKGTGAGSFTAQYQTEDKPAKGH